MQNIPKSLNSQITRRTQWDENEKQQEDQGEERIRPGTVFTEEDEVKHLKIFQIRINTPFLHRTILNDRWTRPKSWMINAKERRKSRQQHNQNEAQGRSNSLWSRQQHNRKEAQGRSNSLWNRQQHSQKEARRRNVQQSWQHLKHPTLRYKPPIKLCPILFVFPHLLFFPCYCNKFVFSINFCCFSCCCNK
jgi:hypothetical protein